MTATFHLKVDRQLRVVTADEILADLEASPIPEPEPEFMSTKEVADALEISREMVRYYSNTGALPEAFRTVAGHRRFRTSDVRALQQELPEVTTAPTRLHARGRGTYVPAQLPPVPGTAAADCCRGVPDGDGAGGGSVTNPDPPPAQSFPTAQGGGDGTREQHVSENPIHDSTVAPVDAEETAPEEAPQEGDGKSFAEVADHDDEDDNQPA